MGAVSASPTAGTAPPPSDGNRLGAIIDAKPGDLLIVGNEVDRRALQDETPHRRYSEAYHDVYHLIKARDPSAKSPWLGSWG